jgi:predicted Zn-dependent protease
MVKTLLFALAAAVAVPTVADACMNGVEWTTDDYVRVVMKAEKQVEAGDFVRAKRSLRMRFPAQLADRVADLNAIITLRTTQEAKQLEGARARFKKRMDAKPTELRFKAWYAETQLALGAKDEARTILAELKERDLLPDAYAVHALAKLSSGTERYELYKACRARAKNKDMCELPAERSARR